MDEVGYSKLSKEELIEKIRKLECHVLQLRNVITKRDAGGQKISENSRKRTKLDEENGLNSHEKQPEKKASRSFDFTSVSMRHIALKILYLGWNHQGLAVQEDTEDTIEGHLFKALTLTKLIEERSKSNYHRCGRTDKGVSAFCQVISIDLRSKIVNGQETLDYCKLINNTLPKSIRVIAWSSVRSDFSARFDCCMRTYKYFFPKGDLDIQRMVAAAQALVGTHDFRNFCKMDREKDKTTMRRINSVHVANVGSSPYDICHLVINGKAFLWHQIRCIIGVLFLIGQGLEEISVIEELLDVEKNPRKPQFAMGVDYPLNLYEVQYPEEENIKWTYTSENMTALLGDLQAAWMQHSIKADMVKEMIKDIEMQTKVKPTTLVDDLTLGTKRKIYMKVMDLPTCGGD